MNKCCRDTVLLKILAIFFMIIDHIGAVFFPSMEEFRMLGRLALPLFCWCLVLGADYTKNIYKYLLRLLFLGFLSQPLYIMALNHTWQDLNILFTLSIGLIAIIGIKLKKYASHILLPIISLILASLIHVDYGFNAVLFIIMLYIIKKEKLNVAVFTIAFCLYWGQGSYIINSAFGINIYEILKISAFKFLRPFMHIQALAMFSLIFILPRYNSKIKINSKLAYAIYPLHLILIIILKSIFAI